MKDPKKSRGRTQRAFWFNSDLDSIDEVTKEVSNLSLMGKRDSNDLDDDV